MKPQTGVRLIIAAGAIIGLACLFWISEDLGGEVWLIGAALLGLGIAAYVILGSSWREREISGRIETALGLKRIAGRDAMCFSGLVSGVRTEVVNFLSSQPLAPEGVGGLSGALGFSATFRLMVSSGAGLRVDRRPPSAAQLEAMHIKAAYIKRLELMVEAPPPGYSTRTSPPGWEEFHVSSKTPEDVALLVNVRPSDLVGADGRLFELRLDGGELSVQAGLSPVTRARLEALARRVRDGAAGLDPVL